MLHSSSRNISNNRVREREKNSDFYREEISVNRKYQQRIEIRFTEISRKRNIEREKIML